MYIKKHTKLRTNYGEEFGKQETMHSIMQKSPTLKELKKQKSVTFLKNQSPTTQ